MSVSSGTMTSGVMPPPPYTTRPASELNFGFAFFSASVSSESGRVSTKRPSASSLRSRWMDRPLGVYHLPVVILSS